MSFVTHYLKQNFTYGTLNGSINNSVTSIVLNSGHNYPVDTAKNFVAIIWDSVTYPDPTNDPNAEIVLGVYSGILNTYTIVRAQEGTTAVSHISGSSMAMTITGGVIEQIDSFVPRGMQYFNSSGTWTKPWWVNKVYVKTWGQGGNGNGGGGTSGGQGGGGGGYSEGVIDVTGNVAVSLGSGVSSFAGVTTIQSTDASGTTPGVGSGGTINLTGAIGAQGGTGSGNASGGSGGGSPFGGSGGGGGASGQTGTVSAGDGCVPGGGGGGGAPHAAAAVGGVGGVAIYW